MQAEFPLVHESRSFDVQILVSWRFNLATAVSSLFDGKLLLKGSLNVLGTLKGTEPFSHVLNAVLMAHDMRTTSPAGTSSGDASNGCIVHHVSKLDTLAGVAIKYGVEVADIKRLNGLLSDFEMFAHKTLRIPIFKRHPITSNFLKPRNSSLAHPYSNGSTYNTHQGTGNNNERKGPDKKSSSSAMNLLRGYYGLPSPAQPAENTDSRIETAYKVKVIKNSVGDVFSLASVVDLALRNGPACANEAYENGMNVRHKESTSLPEAGGKSSQVEAVETSGVCYISNDRSVRRRFKSDVGVNSPPEACFNVEFKQDASIMSEVLPSEALLGGKQTLGGLPLSLYKVLDGAMASVKGKENPLLKVQKSPRASNLQDQTSTHVNLGIHNYGFRSEANSAIASIQIGVKTSSNAPPKAIDYRFKAALD